MLPDALIEIITQYTWSQKLNNKRLMDQLNCSISFRENVPPYFLVKTLPIMNLKTKTCKITYSPLIKEFPFIPLNINFNYWSPMLHSFVSQIRTHYLVTNRFYRSSLRKCLLLPIFTTWNKLYLLLEELTEYDVIIPDGFIGYYIRSMIHSIQEAELVDRYRI